MEETNSPNGKNFGGEILNKINGVTQVLRTKNAKMFLTGLVIFLVVCLAVVLFYGVYRVYAKGSTDRFSMKVSQVLRLPAMKINGTRILYADYVDDLNAIHKLRDFNKATNPEAKDLTEEQLTDQVILRFVNTELVKSLAKKYGITVEQKEVDSLRADILSQFKGSVEDANKELDKRYGWNLDTYEKKVMRMYVLEGKVNGAVSADADAREGVKKLAEQVLAQLKGGADFTEMAKRYSQDGSAQSGGDLGWFEKGQMVTEFENAAFALKKGEMTPDLVQTQYGHHILIVDDKKTEETKDSKGKKVSVEKVKARHILFKNPDLSTFMIGAVKNADFILYVKTHNPLDDLSFLNNNVQ